MSAPFCTYKRKEKNGIFTGNKLESTVDIVKDRCSCNDNSLFSGNFLCKKNHEAQTGFKSDSGRHSHYAAGSSADCCRIFPPADLQSSETIR